MAEFEALSADNGPRAEPRGLGPLHELVREAAIVARYEVVALATSLRAALFVVLYGATAVTVGKLLLRLDAATGALGGLSDQAAGVDPGHRDRLVAQVALWLGSNVPPIVSGILWPSAFVLPPLILLIGHAIIAEDTSTRFARFVLQRVSRGAYLAGKMAALFAVAYAGVLVVHLALLAYAATSLAGFDPAATLAALPRVWTALAVFIAAHVAYAAAFSARLTPPFFAFAAGAMALFALWVVSFSRAGRFWMGSWSGALFNLDLDALAIYAIHTAVLTGAAWLALARRDV